MKLFIADNYNLTREELDVFRAMGYEITVARPNQAPSEVCQYCGFGDYANFYRAFRAEYHITPRQYAQSQRETPTY